MESARLLDFYKQMLRIRHAEETVEELREEGHVVASPTPDPDMTREHLYA